MPTVQVALYIGKQKRFVSLDRGWHGTQCLSWGKRPVPVKMVWPNRLWVKRDGSFAVNFKGRAYLRIRYG
jgi:hypothetical protein